MYESNTTFKRAIAKPLDRKCCSCPNKTNKYLFSPFNIICSPGWVTILTADVSRTNYGSIPW